MRLFARYLLKENMKTIPSLHFYQQCLKCKSLNGSRNYICGCSSEPWTREYRILDLNYELTVSGKSDAADAFEKFDMDHPCGILQYFFTPNREYSNFIQLKTGLTPFITLNNLSTEYGYRIFVKNEGDNPSGCFKDRETVMAALHSIAEGMDKSVVHSSGNAAASASLYAAHTGFQLITFVAGNTYPEKIDYIRGMGSDVISIGNKHTTFEEGYRLFTAMNVDGIFNEQGFDNWSVRNPYRIAGDKTSAIEIAKQYQVMTGAKGTVPDYIFVPTGNGSCLTGIWKGFRELRSIGVTGTHPHMVSVAIRNASPVYKAFRKNITNRPAVCDPREVAGSDREIGSTILAEEGYDSIEATKAVIESGGLAMEVTKDEIRDALIDLLDREHEIVQHHNLLPEPASLVPLAAIKKMKDTEFAISGSADMVAFFTGHGAKAGDLIMKLLKDRPDLQNMVQQLINRRINSTGNGKENGIGTGKATRTVTRPGRLVHVSKDIHELTSAFKLLNDKKHASRVFPV
jgi:threonine synthase